MEATHPNQNAMAPEWFFSSSIISLHSAVCCCMHRGTALYDGILGIHELPFRGYRDRTYHTSTSVFYTIVGSGSLCIVSNLGSHVDIVVMQEEL